MLNKKEVKRQLKALWKKLDFVEKISNESKTLSQYANQGYVELHNSVKNLKDSNVRMSEDITNIKDNIPKITEGVESKLSSNLKWIIGITITLLSLYTGLIIFILTMTK